MEADRLGRSKGLKAPVVVVVDTNFLMQMAEGLVAPSMLERVTGARARLVIPRAVLDELSRLASGHPKHRTRRLAARALELVGRLGLEVLGGAGDADDAVESLALRFKSAGSIVAVATSDRELRRRLRMHGIPTIYYRESEGLLESDWDLDLL